MRRATRRRWGPSPSASGRRETSPLGRRRSGVARLGAPQPGTRPSAPQAPGEGARAAGVPLPQRPPHRGHPPRSRHGGRHGHPRHAGERPAPPGGPEPRGTAGPSAPDAVAELSGALGQGVAARDPPHGRRPPDPRRDLCGRAERGLTDVRALRRAGVAGPSPGGQPDPGPDQAGAGQGASPGCGQPESGPLSPPGRGSRPGPPPAAPGFRPRSGRWPAGRAAG